MSVNTAAQSAGKPAKKKVSKFSKRKVDPAFYWMTVPAAILVGIFLYFPFLQGAMYSFTNSQGYGDFKFIGLKNYFAMFQDARVGHAYLFTIFIAVLITIGTNFLGMFLAVLLNSKIAFKNGFRAIFFIPYTLSNPDLAWFPIVFLSIWQGVAYSTLLYLAGLQTIDNEIYEAAAIDGVSAWQNFWQITFPLIGPFFTINMVLSLKNSLGAFDQIMALTKGGPDSKTETVSYLIFQNGLGNGEYSYQMANAVTFFIVLAVLAFVQLKFFGNKEKV